MDNLDDSENNAKVSDSGYSNSCSNSQSRRSNSSKSMHSGSNSSGSSGYGGKPSTSDYSTNLDLPTEKKSKDVKKKKQVQVDLALAEAKVDSEIRSDLPIEASKEKSDDVPLATPMYAQSEKALEKMDIATTDMFIKQDEAELGSMAMLKTSTSLVICPNPLSSNGFSCVISMHDGVVIYTTSSLTTSLGFPKHMWIGRSFIDFIHPQDRYTFASQITSGLAAPKNANGIQGKVLMGASVSTLVCRIRQYRGLIGGFAVKDQSVAYLPFLLKLSFKDITDEEGKIVYLVLQATQFISAFKTANETVTNPLTFVIRHAPNGNIEYMGIESVPYLGNLPQELSNKDILQLYHPDDLPYLRQVYETIVKEGKVPRSESYRLLAQNGDYLKVRTEWSSFTNPWSKKLEFVIGKHHVMEGPTNPDVFLSANIENSLKLTVEEMNKAMSLRESIVRIMNEVLTKPAEAAKQHMTKRCQDLTSLMESLIEEQPKADEELRLEIQDPDHSYYERDSVMLGGISPHHDYNDSKSSSETPLSYTQLNYNKNLQRYFDSHQPYSYEDYNTATGENILDFKQLKPIMGDSLLPTGQHTADTGDTMSSSDSCIFIGDSSPSASVDYQPERLTESRLNKHNTDMQKELVQMHRESRSTSGAGRDKPSDESRQKKQEHLARCNTAFQPAGQSSQAHGVKRRSKKAAPNAGALKRRCSSNRHRARSSYSDFTPPAPPAPPAKAATAATAVATTTTTTTAQLQWTNPSTSMNMFVLGVGPPQTISLMNPGPAVPGMFPMCYSQSAASTPASTASTSNSYQRRSHQHTAATPCNSLMYGPPMCGGPSMYPPVNHHLPYPLHDSLMAQTLMFSNFNNNMIINKTHRNQTTGNLSTSQKTHFTNMWAMGSALPFATTVDQGNRDSTSNHAPNQGTDSTTDVTGSRDTRNKTTLGTGEDRTDGESSYSSFYSSFFRTDSGSAEESGDQKKTDDNVDNTNGDSSCYQPPRLNRMPRRKMEPPWMEQVSATSELIYKYQILTKNLEEVLAADKKKMTALEQPSLVNEQLQQLYLDLQMQGLASQLTLEEGVTSSSSSGEDLIEAFC